MSVINQQLYTLCQLYGFSGVVEQRLVAFVDLLQRWNRRTNLISRSDGHQIVTKHIADSLAFLKLNVLHPLHNILDFGSGAGFPGLILKIAAPELQINLLDSKRIKVLFLREAIAALELSDVNVLLSRAEELSRDPNHDRYDFVLARAVASLVTLWTGSTPLLRPGGYLLAQKGGDLHDEVSQLLQRFPGCIVQFRPVLNPFETSVHSRCFAIVQDREKRDVAKSN